MKLQTRDIPSFLKHLPDNIKAVLIYGPDQGLVKERAKILGRLIVKDLSDPFNVIELNKSSLIADPAKLTDEACSLSMLGGQRLIRVLQATDEITQSCKALLENDNLENFVIVESDNLGPSSPLRQLFEKIPHAAALPCYVEEGRGLADVIRQIIAEHKKTLQPDALQFLTQNIQGDRMMVRSELEKLVTYVGEKDPISLKDAQETMGSRGETSFSAVCFATAGGDVKTTCQKLTQALEEGFPPTSMVRALQNHIKRLHKAKTLMAQGINSKEAMNSLQPKIFFKEAPVFEAQLHRWSLKALENVLTLLYEAEKQTKTTHMPADTYCQQVFLTIARKARG